MHNHKLYSTPNGLGGRYTVRIIDDFGNGLAHVRVEMPERHDIHGNDFLALELTPLTEGEPCLTLYKSSDHKRKRSGRPAIASASRKERRAG